MLTRRTAKPKTTGSENSQQTNPNKPTVQKRPATAVEDHHASTSASLSRKKIGGRRTPTSHVHDAPPVPMDDGSGVDVPAIASQDHNLPVAHARRQAQALNRSTSANTSLRVVPDDEDLTDEDDIYGGIEGDVGDALRSELPRFDDEVPELCHQQSPSSLCFDELQPTDDDNEDKVQYEDQGESEIPLIKKMRTDLRREEIPTWKEVPEPGDSDEDKLAVETSLAAGQKRKFRRDSGPRVLSTSNEFPDASYLRPAAGQVLGITDQPDKLRMVLSFSVRQVIRHAISKSTYIATAKTHSTLCKIFMQTARSLGQHAFADRLRADVNFQKDVVVMLSNRLSGFRSNVKNTVVVGLVRDWYHLDGPDMKSKAADLIKQDKYIFVSSDTGPDFINRAKPFLHEAIVSTLRSGFFTTNKGESLVKKHADCFKSSVPERSEELEVTAPMVAFAATCVHATLMQICTNDKAGHRRRYAFHTDHCEGVYETHINYLNTIRSKSLPKYHRLMADLYRAASSGTQVNQGNLGQANIDIEGMSE